MKTKILLLALIPLSALYIVSCSKENVAGNTIQSAKAGQLNQVLSACDQFSYGDTIFYPQELPNDYIIHTVTALSGTFGCFPNELKINPTNGDIDITEGETGLKYIVWYVPTGTIDTCKIYLTVSGIDYTDSIYSVKNNPGVATPIYNSTPGLNVSANSVFDDSDQLVTQGVAIDQSTGTINLKQTLANGALGTNPPPGTFKDFLLNYRIADQSNKARNKIAFRLYYYQNKSQIPAKLKKILAAKKSQVILNDGSNHNFNFNNAAASLTSSTGKGGTGEVKCRPPYIIVVAQ